MLDPEGGRDDAPQDDGAHLLETLPPAVAHEVAEVARIVPCTPGQAVMAALFLIDRAIGDRMRVVDPQGRRLDHPLDADFAAPVFADLSRDAMTRLLTLLAPRLEPRIAQMLQVLSSGRR